MGNNSKYEDIDKKAKDLSDEAKKLFHEKFKIPEGFRDGQIDRIVDCIIRAAILEVASSQRKAYMEVFDNENT